MLITAQVPVFWWRIVDDLLEENALLRARVEQLEASLSVLTSIQPEESDTQEE